MYVFRLHSYAWFKEDKELHIKYDSIAQLVVTNFIWCL